MSRKRLLLLLAAVVLLLATTALAAYAAISGVSISFSNPTQNNNAWIATITGTATAGNRVCYGISTTNQTPTPVNECSRTGTSFTCTITGLSSGTLYYYSLREGQGNCANAAGTAVNGSFNISPLAVELASFTATRDAARVHVTWETVSETDNAGFKVYRSATETSERALLTFIPAQTIGGTAGAFYEYTDATAIDPNAVYWLEDIDLSGKATLHGPLTPRANVPNAVSARSFTATPLTPNIPLYLAALFVAAGGLWAAVYRLGRKHVA